MNRICCTCLRVGHLAHACPRGEAIRAAAKSQAQKQQPAAPAVCQGCGKPLSTWTGVSMCVQPGCLG